MLGVIILRAFLFAVVFGALALAVMKLIEIFIPELLSADENDEDNEESDSSVIIEEGESAGLSGNNGSRLDITIDDEEGDASSFESEDGQEIPGAATAPVKEGGSGSAQMQEPAEELEEIGDESPAEPAEEVEEVEELEEVESAEAADGDGNGSVPAKEGGNGKNQSKEGDLPDIGVFSDSFAAAEVAGESEGLSSIDGMGSAGGAEIMGDMHDTQEIVKAVQTVLKKDQEG